MEIRRSYDRLISTMGFPILARCHLYIESGPWPTRTDSPRENNRSSSSELWQEKRVITTDSKVTHVTERERGRGMWRNDGGDQEKEAKGRQEDRRWGWKERIFAVFEIYRKISNISRTKSRNLNDSRLGLPMSLFNQLKPGIKSKMTMWLEHTNRRCSNYIWMINWFIAC